MKITSRQKRKGQGYSVVKTDKRIPIKYDLQVLDLMCTYSISENAYIRKSSLMNLRNLIHLLDMDYYVNDPEKMKRISFIKKALDGRLAKGLKNEVALVKYANGGIIDDTSFIPDGNLLSTEELNWVDENVSESLKYLYLYDNVDELYDLLDKFKNGDFKSKSSIVSQIQDSIQAMQTTFRRVKTESAQAEVFSLRGDRFDNSISDIHRRATDVNRKLLTGMQGFNLLVNGGLQCRRVYGLFGITGVGKSVALLNIAYQIKKYNKGFKPKDPTKTPVVVILTMENDVDETVQRLYSIATGAGPDEFRSLTLDEVKKRLHDDGELYLSDDNPIDILIKYMPSGGVDTNYMYELVEELEDEGYETIAFIQDHLKKIRSAHYKNVDIRLELGEVINEFKAFAIAKDIPVITCSHLNREACAKMEMAAQSSKADVTRMLGKSNVGESMLILDNIDFGFMINVEYDANGNKYLCVWTQKKRDYTPLDYAVLPFENGSGIKLAEDFYLDTPLFKDTVGNVHELNRAQTNTSQYSSIKLLYEDDEDDNDIFSSATSYNIDNPNPDPLPGAIMPIPQPEMIECVRFVSNPARRDDIGMKIEVA